ncbi:ABC transporter permease subunit [Paenibacillus sp. LMG 31461]|uniref:ABC transporter permease subunit n=2 Tax=Paenibacillus plantarum TaxID=2654975 RepID=A0ABX1XFC1_9BACL|nr:ABC transporter permease subunit [Paenibacillus plantarum]NOU67097.1 ABC transporter permease subunit [Paenibacillus plantarum]
MLLPASVVLLINNYLPMFGIIIAFKNINLTDGILGSPWIGLDNFTYLFKTNDAWIITRNTLLYNALFIVLNIVIGVSFAIMLNELRSRLLSKFFQSTMFLPYFLSAIVTSYLVFGFLGTEHGFINNTLLPFIGLKPISWYSEPQYWPYILSFVHTWKTIGYSTVMYLAVIIGIDHEYYEAATLDGASKWKQMIHITLPSLVPIIIILALLAIGRIFYTDFGLFFQVPLNSGSLFSTTNVIDTYVYRTFITLGDIGMSTAAGLYQSLVGFVMVFFSNYIVRRINKENALF